MVADEGKYTTWCTWMMLPRKIRKCYAFSHFPIFINMWPGCKCPTACRNCLPNPRKAKCWFYLGVKTQNSCHFLFVIELALWWNWRPVRVFLQNNKHQFLGEIQSVCRSPLPHTIKQITKTWNWLRRVSCNSRNLASILWGLHLKFSATCIWNWKDWAPKALSLSNDCQELDCFPDHFYNQTKF